MLAAHVHSEAGSAVHPPRRGPCCHLAAAARAGGDQGADGACAHPHDGVDGVGGVGGVEWAEWVDGVDGEWSWGSRWG